MNLRAKNIVCTLIAGSCLGVLTAQQGGRGPAQTWWVAKTKGGVYIPPNKPLTRLADLKAMHAGQTNWTEVVVKDPEDEAYYNSAAPGAKFGRRMHPDTGTLMVVVEGEMHFDIAGQDPIAATRGSIVNILRTTPYAYQVTGDKPALWVQISPANFKTVYPADSPPPPVTPGAEIVKVSFPSSPPAYNAPNIPHWNLFEGAKSDATGYRALQDHLFANPIYGYADPNDPQNPNRGNPSAKGKGGGRGRGGRQRRAFQLKFGFWPCASGTGGVVDRAVGSGHRAVRKHRRVRWRGGGILYAAPMTWHQMGFKGPGLSCRLALGGYNFINMNNTAGQ